MLTDLPLSTVIAGILGHTPRYVWAILAALVLLGAIQARDHTISRGRLAIAPLTLGAYSLWSASAAFGTHAGVVGAWLAGTALAFVVNRRLGWPRHVRAVEGGFALQGSPWPLVLMLAIFVLRYAVAVSLALQPALRANPAFGASLALAYGALSGLFAARALRILRSGPAPAALASA